MPWRPTSGQRLRHYWGFVIALRHTTLATTPLEECSARLRLLPDNTQYSKETDIHAPVGFEPTMPASKWPQTDILDRVATMSYTWDVKTKCNVWVTSPSFVQPMDTNYYEIVKQLQQLLQHVSVYINHHQGATACASLKLQWSERENQQDATVRCLLSTLTEHVSHSNLHSARTPQRSAPQPLPTTSSRNSAAHHM